MTRISTVQITLFTAFLSVACDLEASSDPLGEHDIASDEVPSFAQPGEPQDAADPAVRDLGVEAYAVHRLAEGVSVDLLGADGSRAGSLTVTGVEDHTPNFDLSWDAQRVRFAVDLTRPDAPLSITLGEVTATVLHDGEDWNVGDAQALELLDRVAEPWQLARAAFTDAHLDGDLLDYVNRTHFGAAPQMSVPALENWTSNSAAGPCPGTQCTQNTCAFWPRLSQWAYLPLINQCVGTNSCGC